MLGWLHTHYMQGVNNASASQRLPSRSNSPERAVSPSGRARERNAAVKPSAGVAAAQYGAQVLQKVRIGAPYSSMHACHPGKVIDCHLDFFLNLQLISIIASPCACISLISSQIAWYHPADPSKRQQCA